MKYALYLILLYVFLLINSYVDLITVLIFFIAFNEEERFALIFSFFAGLLIDLYNPFYLGLNALVFTILVQLLIMVKRYIAQIIGIILTTFIVFFVAKLLILHAALGSATQLRSSILTIVVFVPAFLMLNRIINHAWMKT